MKLSDTAIRHPTTVLVLMLMLAVFGFYAYTALPREAAPDVKLPLILVTVNYRGTTPEDMENSVTIPIEKHLRGLKDVKQVTSRSDEGSTLIVVEFYSGTVIEDALQRVRDKVDQARVEIPAEADQPSVREINLSEFPIINISLTGDVGPLRLKQMADDVADQLQTIEGVLEASVVGGVTREIRVELDPDRVASYRIPVADLLGLIAQENVNVSGGSLEMDKGRYQLRVPGELVDPSEIYRIVIMTRDGKPVYVTDVAEVVDGFADRTSYSRMNGQDSVSIVVSKRSGENVPRIAAAIKDFMANHSHYILGDHVTYAVTQDVSRDIKMMVEDLESNIVSGLILIVVVLMLVMGLRNSFFVALAIPFSMLITFSVLFALNITLNMVVLFSLTLALGMLVDDAIVIVENIFRHMQEGQSRIDAAINATREVAWPVITSTLTTMGAFLPMLFWPDIVGDFMSYLPKTVIIALAASLLVALVINPALAGAVMRKPKVLEKDRKRWFVMRGYMRLVRFSVDHPLVIVFMTMGIFVGSLGLLGVFWKGVEFFPESDPPRCYINVTLGEGTKLDATDAAVREVARRIHNIPGVQGDMKYIVESSGARAGTNPLAGGQAGSIFGQVMVEFVDRDLRSQSSSETVKQIRQALGSIPGARVEVEKEQHGPPTGAPVNIEVSGEDFDVLADLTRRVKTEIRPIPGLVDLQDDYESAKPEIQFPVDRSRAKLLGVSTAWVAQFIKVAVNGIKIGTYREGDEEYDIVIRLADRFRYDLDRIRSLYIPDSLGRQIPLSSLTSVEYRGGYGAINRKDQKRLITVQAQNAEGVRADVVLNAVKAKLQDFRLPPGYRISYTGQDEEQQKASSFLLKAMVAALFIIVLILVSEFDSLKLPFIIMLTVLLSFIGVALGLVFSGKPFGVIMTGIGIITLAGVVVKNGIVLIAYVEQLRERGMNAYEAVVQAGIIRMRPVLLTALTAILGLVPMAVGVSYNVRQLKFELNSEMSQWWGPMAVVVIYGLSVATLLTLVVVPAFYTIFLRLAGHPRPDRVPPPPKDEVPPPGSGSPPAIAPKSD